MNVGMKTGYISFIRENAPFLATGALLSFMSCLGQTFFISIFGGEIRESFGLSNGDWGLLYMVGTMASAGVMVFAGGRAGGYLSRANLGDFCRRGFGIGVPRHGI